MDRNKVASERRGRGRLWKCRGRRSHIGKTGNLTLGVVYTLSVKMSNKVDGRYEQGRLTSNQLNQIFYSSIVGLVYCHHRQGRRDLIRGIADCPVDDCWTTSQTVLRNRAFVPSNLGLILQLSCSSFQSSLTHQTSVPLDIDVPFALVVSFLSLQTWTVLTCVFQRDCRLNYESYTYFIAVRVSNLHHACSL